MYKTFVFILESLTWAFIKANIGIVVIAITWYN